MSDKGKRITQTVVGGLIGLALIFAAFYLTGPGWGAFLMGVLLFEGWTLIDDQPGNTISEAIWKFSERPLIPWMFGVTTGIGLATGYLADPYVVGALAFVQGHFFFSRYESK